MTKNDGWAYLPEDGRNPRLIRFVDHRDGLLSRYLSDANIVEIDRGYYAALDSLDQGRALATHDDLYVAVRGGRVSIR